MSHLDLDSHTRLYLVFAIGLGVAVVGLINALVAPRLRGQLLAAVVGCGIATGGVMLFEPALAGITAAVYAGLATVWLVARSPVVQAIVGLFRPTRVRWAAVTGLAMAVAMAEVVRFEQAESARADLDLLDLAEMAYRPVTVPEPAIRTATDSGTPVAVESSAQPRDSYDVRAAEDAVLAAFPRRDQVIRRAPGNDQSNCHGWVFTGGRYVVRGGDVDRILAENGYTPAAQPRPDDVCVYRGANNAVSHTALVRGVIPDGTVLVEGKWGCLGVFLHPAESSCYGTDYTFYRSHRNGHLLTGLSDPTPATNLGEAAE